jgi:WD40 repeat protein
MKTYKIITLGASGSGKTVFLASMFKALGIQVDHGFYLHAISRDNRILASGSEDCTIKLWDLSTGSLVTTLTGQTGGVRTLTFSPDNQINIS